MKMICSASKGVSAKVDTANTLDLLLYLRKHGLASEVVLGTWQGHRELSVQVTGFDSLTDMQDLGAFICERWNQDAVYYSMDCEAFTIDRLGAVLALGTEWHDTSVPMGTAAYTQYLNGVCLYTLKETEQVA